MILCHEIGSNRPRNTSLYCGSRNYFQEYSYAMKIMGVKISQAKEEGNKFTAVTEQPFRWRREVGDCLQLGVYLLRDGHHSDITIRNY